MSEVVKMAGEVPQLTPDDIKVIEQIRSAPSPDAKIDVDLESILNMISQGILPLVDSKKDSAVLDDRASEIPDALALTIHEIGCELSCNCAGEGDLNAITLLVFNKVLKNYEWDAKVVLALAAFAASYGEFFALSQLRASSKLVKYAHILKPLPRISERESLITELLKVVVQVSDCIIKLIDLPTQYISRDMPPLSNALTIARNSAYVAIKGIIACSFQSIGLISVGHQYTVPITEPREKLTELTQTLKGYNTLLTKQLDLCKTYREKEHEVYVTLKRKIQSGTTHTDGCIDILKEIIDVKTEPSPLFNGGCNKSGRLNVLEGKTVIFFFSYLNISDEEIQEIKLQVGEQEKGYEIVWLPINGSVDTNEFERKAKSMPWYSMHYSLVLHPGAIKFVKKRWHFEKKPLLVVFDAQGSVICPNAYYSMMIWGSKAYPFNHGKVHSLWKETTWSLQRLLLDENDKKQLVNESKIVCFYGGSDIDWIRKFTSKIKKVVQVEGVTSLELIYVGKKNIDTITAEKLSECWITLKKKRFYARLESIMCSKLQLGLTIETDAVLKDVMMVLGAEGSGEGWTLIAHGSKDLVPMNANTTTEWLVLFKKVLTVKSEDFISKVQQVLKTIDLPARPKHCNHIAFHDTSVINQESIVCVNCKRPMEKVIVYKCCDEE